MARRTWGVPASKPTQKGEWGGGYQIEKRYSARKVSCYTCVHVGDHSSCRKYGTFIPKIGSDSWKSCKSFMLSNEYSNSYNDSVVMSQKGKGYIQEELKLGNEEKDNYFTGFLSTQIKAEKSSKKCQKSNTNDALNKSKKKVKKDQRLENYFIKNNVIDINVDELNRSLNCFDDSYIELNPKIVRNICLYCLDRLLNPNNVIGEAEDKLAKYLYFHQEITDEGFKDKLLIKIIVKDLGGDLDDILFLDDLHAGRMIGNFYNNDRIDVYTSGLGGEEYYICTEEYAEAKRNLKKGILTHYNPETGFVIDLDPMQEKLYIYGDGFEDEERNAYISRLYFHRWGNMFYEQRIIAGEYILDSEIEYYDEVEE